MECVRRDVVSRLKQIVDMDSAEHLASMATEFGLVQLATLEGHEDRRAAARGLKAGVGKHDGGDFRRSCGANIGQIIFSSAELSGPIPATPS